MSSKRRIRRKSCEGKQRHNSKTEAVAHIINERRNGNTGLCAYKCRFCGGWHVGHKPKKVKMCEEIRRETK